ncbi:multicopper oxidase family protein [Actinospica robiniae]|uniref:multicopper oxidase family protein n=1 Tax=Actinospica robiniae TaxID=304901 RepID=UPI000407EE53|nr:multicopper oxidase family protein [Actinospica robiniae]
MTAHLDRRAVLRAGTVAGAGLLLGTSTTACSVDSVPASIPYMLIEPTDPSVAARESARHHSGATRTVTLDPVPTRVDLGGVVVDTWTYGGTLPGAEIRVNRGDLITAHLANHLPAETTVHWHGIAIRNNMDGTPQVTQNPVKPGAAFTYTFVTANPGTYWLHPHVGVQQDRGLYAPLIVEDPGEKADYDHDWTVVLDDWIDGVDGQSPDSVLATLRRGMTGMSADPSPSASETAMSMPGMDMSSTPMAGGSAMLTGATSDLLGGDGGDVRYPYYLVNGRLPTDPVTFNARPGQRARIRIINAGADSAFRVALGGHTLTVTHTDGQPVQPVQATSLLLGMGERYDVEVTLHDGVFPLVALAEGRNATAHAIVRTASGRAPAPDARPAELAAAPIGYSELRATDAYQLGAETPDVSSTLRLTGGMKHYDWRVNGLAYNAADPLMRVEVGQRARIAWTNTTAMWHPMHLHGHSFQLANGGPRKDTVIVLPGRSVAVDFDADNPGQWMTHCHNAYHAAAGMMGVIGYQTTV